VIRALAATILLGLASAADAACRQALALGLDVSGSVDAREYRLQLDGLAGALTHDHVARALLSAPEAPVEMAIFLWSAPEHQRVIVDWTALTTRDVIDEVAAKLRALERRPAPPGTALGTAMETGAALLAQRARCWTRTLDLSGDGKPNMGPSPQAVKARLAMSSITINALVIGADAPRSGDLRQVEIGELSSYFRTHVIVGPDAFVQTALGFDDYEAAMTRKLLRELRTRAFAQGPDPGKDQ
jgi:hypothetical protein